VTGWRLSLQGHNSFPPRLLPGRRGRFL